MIRPASLHERQVSITRIGQLRRLASCVWWRSLLRISNSSPSLMRLQHASVCNPCAHLTALVVDVVGCQASSGLSSSAGKCRTLEVSSACLSEMHVYTSTCRACISVDMLSRKRRELLDEGLRCTTLLDGSNTVTLCSGGTSSTPHSLLNSRPPHTLSISTPHSFLNSRSPQYSSICTPHTSSLSSAYWSSREQPASPQIISYCNYVQVQLQSLLPLNLIRRAGGLSRAIPVRETRLYQA